MKARNQAELKETNRNLLIKLILTCQPISRVDLAKKTGLPKMTVTNIINELLEDGIVKETGVLTASEGRKPIGLEIVDGCHQFLGVYICRDSVSVFSGDMKGTIFSRKTVSLCNETNESLLEKIVGLLNEYDMSHYLAIGISSIGPLDMIHKAILNPPDFHRVANLSLGEYLEKQYHLPVFMDNDMNTSALAEKYFGHGRTLSNFIYLGVSHGIGAGIVTNKSLYLGHCGFSGEVGHITVDMHGKRCSCGNIGCLELYASFPDNWNTLDAQQQHSSLRRICDYLAVGCITLINLFDPSVIFLGHEISVCAQEACTLISQAISQRYLGSQYRNVSILPSSFQKDAPVVGALALCVDQLFR